MTRPRTQSHCLLQGVVPCTAASFLTPLKAKDGWRSYPPLHRSMNPSGLPAPQAEESLDTLSNPTSEGPGHFHPPDIHVQWALPLHPSFPPLALSVAPKLRVRMCLPSCFHWDRLFATPQTVACQAPLSMGILQARILEWLAMFSSRGSS